MKTTTVISTFLLSCFLHSLSAQSLKQKYLTAPFVDGYIVTKANDTLSGQVSIASQKNNISFIAFRGQEGKKNIYTANDIAAFGQQQQSHDQKQAYYVYTDKSWVHYESKEHPRKFGQKLFLERIISGGRINLYLDAPVHEPATALVGLKREVKEQTYVVHKKGMKPFVLRHKNFQHDAKVLFSDCTAFIEYMQAHADKFRFKNIGFIIEGYNRSC